MFSLSYLPDFGPAVWFAAAQEPLPSPLDPTYPITVIVMIHNPKNDIA
jgi:hypothetical protein